KTGELTGILRNCSRFIPIKTTEREPSNDEKRERLLQLFRDYNSVGLTTIADRDASPAAIDLYRDLRARGDLTLRIAVSHDVGSLGDIAKIQDKIREVAANPLFKEKDE